MNSQEFQKILLVLNTPWFPKIESNAEIDWWYSKLKDMDYKAVAFALDKLADTEEFRPNIARINRAISELTGSTRMTAIEAWNLLIKKTGLSVYASREQLESLPDDIRRAIDAAGRYGNLARDESGFAQKKFMDAWNGLTETAKKEELKQLGSTLMLGDGHGKLD